MRPSRHIPALVLGLLCLIPLLAASVAWFDDGELAAAAATLGVPHPTGFPLFVMGNHGAVLLPFGSLAFRIHLAGAVVALCAVALCWSAIGPKGRLSWPWTFGAMVIALSSPSLAMHIRATEVYPWVWLHASCVLWVALRTQGAKRLVGLWALGGMGIVIHSESAALSLLFALAALVTAKIPWPSRLRALVSGCALAVIVAAGTVALPLMAARDPMLSW
ncbi:MAG TPA: hypothetical protein DCQ06_03275, partial [Myxococcales bacterium]|nr:hypothetical protein [Myxococcales bacterium]HAN30597.1 hypothetical protein [Myxococcales bacterium]